MSAMATIRLKRLTCDKSENITRYYVRLPGRAKIRIDGEPGSEEFMAAYRAALVQHAPAEASRPGPTIFGTKSLGAAVQGYYTCSKFKQLSESRQHSRRLILNKILDEHGAKPIRAITRSILQKSMDRRAATPAAANEFLKSMRAVFDYLGTIAERTDTVENPARDVSYNKIDSEGFHVWTVDEVAHYLKHHVNNPKATLALFLLLLTGLSRADMVALGRQHIQSEFFVLRRRKTKAGLTIPVLPFLRSIIDKTPARNMTFLVTQFDKPFTSAGFGNWFRKRCDEAGLQHCSAHGLRKAGATIAADLGASDRQLMALFGWKTPKQVSTYTRSADQKHLATETALRIMEALTANKIVPPQEGLKPHRDKTAN